jgi:hypothetical protein
VRATTAVLLVALTSAVALACGSDGEPDGTDAAAGDTTTSSVAVAAMGSDDLFGVRYCVVLTITVGGSTAAEVWASQGLNDCPQDQLESIDPAAVATELGVTAAVVNGPRYWVLDRIAANDIAGSLEVRRFGGIEMRSIALVDLGPGVPEQRSYTETPVMRDTEFTFAEGREIHELTSPDGSVYVMQSFSNEVDPTLTADALGDLGDRLALPDGWAYDSRTLDETLVVADIDGIATVVQDDLKNTYQLLLRADRSGRPRTEL